MKINRIIAYLPACIALFLPALAHANDADLILSTSADLIWVAMSAALVFFMQAGFALLESGSARAKNSVNVIMKNYADLCVGILAYWLVGYGLMFGSTSSGWLGLDHFFPQLTAGREAVFFLFQAMFAATAATIVSGAVAERMRFLPYVLGSIVITGIIYPVFGSWAWGSFYNGTGWLRSLGFTDFAGSTVVHSVGGWCALAAVIVLGPRTGRFSRDGIPRRIPGHNMPMVGLGVFVLWFGWFGFNGGSTMRAGEGIGPILVTTQLAGAAGVIGALLLMSIGRLPVYMSTAINGGLGGLVAITAGCATMSAGFAILTGFVGGAITVLGSRLLLKLRLDDVVDAIPVHAFCGVWGTLAAGLFFTGDMFSMERILVQAIGIVAAFCWVFPVALVLFAGLRTAISLRVDSIHEQRGLDYSEHYESGYPEFQPDLTNRGFESDTILKGKEYDHVVVTQHS